ncbi:MAG TPA: diguanylate cyclase [Bryobacteraceae bacterium]|jgi:diguanylate cyclase (GGDEF)-like protein
MNLRVLLVESEPEEALFLRDVLAEMNERRYEQGRIEYGQIETFHAASWAEAESLLAQGGIAPQVILLDPDLSDRQGGETYRAVQAAAPEIPVILLVNALDESMAVKLMREGAQDFLVKKHIDCVPLRHAMRNAVARQHLLNAAQAAALTDALTGLPNRAGFLALAARDRKLAERLGRRWMLLVGVPRNLREIAAAHGDQRRDLELVETADHLRGTAHPTDLVARIGAGQFAITVFDTEYETVEEAWIRIRGSAAERRIDVGASIYDPARPISLDGILDQAAQDLLPTRMPEQRQPVIRVAGAA